MARWKETLKDRIDDLPDRVVPSDFLGHLRSSQKEMLLAFRSIIDFWVEALEATERKKPPRRTSIEIEEDEAVGSKQ